MDRPDVEVIRGAGHYDMGTLAVKPKEVFRLCDYALALEKTNGGLAAELEEANADSVDLRMKNIALEARNAKLEAVREAVLTLQAYGLSKYFWLEDLEKALAACEGEPWLIGEVVEPFRHNDEIGIVTAATSMPSMDIEAIRERVEAATKGPWKVDHRARTHVQIQGKNRSVCSTGSYSSPDDATDDNRANTTFIAHAPQDIRDLLDRNALLEAVRRTTGALMHFLDEADKSGMTPFHAASISEARLSIRQALATCEEE